MTLDINRCPSCGKNLSPVWRTRCEHCKTPFSPELVQSRALGLGGVAIGAVPADDPPVFTRTYKGKPDELETMRRVDAEALAAKGYFPKSQDYTPGSWSGGAWIMAVLLIFLFGLGILVLIYLVAVKPPGTMSVIYERAAAAPAASATRDRSPSERLRMLEELRDGGSLTGPEYEAKRQALIAEL